MEVPHFSSDLHAWVNYSRHDLTDLPNVMRADQIVDYLRMGSSDQMQLPRSLIMITVVATDSQYPHGSILKNHDATGRRATDTFSNWLAFAIF